jgi:hypothetical protein
MFAARHEVAGAPLRLAGNLAWGVKRARTLGSLAECGTAEFARRVQRTLVGSSSGTKL